MSADTPDTDNAAYWLDQLVLADREEREWRRDCEKIIELYRGDCEGSGRSSRVNIFSSNVAVLRPAVYSQRPAADVRRRHVDQDPQQAAVGRMVAELIDRVVAYETDGGEFDVAMEAVRDDMLLAGRGTARIRYESTIERRTDIQVVEGMTDPSMPTIYVMDGAVVEPDFAEDGSPYVDVKSAERVVVEPVMWADLRMSPARKFQDVWWIAIRHAMSWAELVEHFGAIGERVPLNIGSHQGATRQALDPVNGSPADPPSRKSRAEVYEVWCRPTRERIWVAEGFDTVIRRDPDPLGLRDFYPIPMPVYSPITTSDTMIPVPEYQICRDQYQEIDELQGRIRHLERAMRAICIVSGDVSEITAISSAADGSFIPVDRNGQQATDLAGDIFWWPAEKLVGVITTLQERVAELKAQVFELTGLADLQRGVAEPRVSAAAERTKGAYSQIRMTPRSLPMARHVQALYRMIAEIACEHYDRATLERISGLLVDDAMFAMIRDEGVRDIEISVSTDALVAPNVLAEREQAVEFMTASTAYLQQVAAVAPVLPAAVPLLFEIFKQASRTMKWADSVEPMIDKTVAALSAPPPPLAPPQMGMQ